MIHGTEVHLPPTSPPTPARESVSVERKKNKLGDRAQAEGHRLILAAGIDRLESRLERLLAASELSADQVRTLTRHLTAPKGPTATDTRLAQLTTGIDALQRRLEELQGTVTRQNDVQFKANALLDGKGQEVAQAISVLQELATRREQAREDLEEEAARRGAELRAEGRAELAADLLPVLDSIERALEGGLQLLAEKRAEPSRPDRRGLWGTIFRGRAGAVTEAAASDGRLEGALEAWLEGLALGRERFLELLEREDMLPVEALDSPFDPHFHVAVGTETREDVAPGTVVRVLRSGFRRGKRAVRFAEVVVARAPDEPEA